MKSISEINWQDLNSLPHTPSPENWSDQVFYFVMTDRFSDGREKGFIENDGKRNDAGTTPAYRPQDFENAIQTEDEAARWRAAGDTFVGGTLQGLTSKLGYLKRLGVTTIWLSPVLKQAAHDKTAYHGYNTQDFLNVDPHYGTREELRQMVATAHKLGIYVVLDIIFNHAGFVFQYDRPYLNPPEGEPPFNYQGKYPVAGFCDPQGKPTLPFQQLSLDECPQAWPDGAVWPRELQSSKLFNCRGCISDWHDPENYLNGDFLYCKDFNLGEDREGKFLPSRALMTLIDVYKYWIGFADLDGFRIDAVKHVPDGATQLFIKEIKAYAREMGKTNFLTIGEIAGGIPNAKQVLAKTGLDAALGIDDLPQALVDMVRGTRNPSEYFSFFENELQPDETQNWSHHNLITLYDDHDQIRLGFDKARFPAISLTNQKLANNAIFTLLTTQGIPCIYYGSEQAFDGSGRDDNYIREAMFGGEFGAFRSRGVHFFNEEHPQYQFLKQLLEFRKEHAVLRHGQQQLLEISGDGQHFGLPTMIGGQLKGVIPWLRYDDQQAVLCAINTDVDHEVKVWVKVPENIHCQSVQKDVITIEVSAAGSKLIEFNK